MRVWDVHPKHLCRKHLRWVGKTRAFMVTRQTLLNSRPVLYSLKRNSRSRHLRVTINCDASVVVSAPIYFADYKIENFLQDKAKWILDKVDHFLRFGKTRHITHVRRGYKKYREEAREFVRRKVEEINAIYNFPFKKIAIRNQKTRWGSCSKKGNLNFNYKIMYLPERLAEYIVAHELCHLQEFNHSKKFWDLVAVAVPDYKECLRQLRKEVII